MKPNIENRTIFCRDNLDVLRGINSDCVDLIYLDPPFNKKKVFTAPIETSAKGASFKDIFTQEDLKEEWVQDISEDHPDIHTLLEAVRSLEGRTSYNFCYLAYMAIRLLECRRVLKDTGSLYLHCDHTMGHYLKLLLDRIFGERNFQNAISWQRNDKRAKGNQFARKKFGSNTDTILFYTKSGNYYLNPTMPLDKREAAAKFNKTDEKGRRYYTGLPVFRSEGMGARPNLCFTWKGFKNPHPSGWRLSKERLDEEYKKGAIVITKDGKLERRAYLDDYPGLPLDDIWTDISRVLGKTSTGYPTQKPIRLLERIIRASSNKDDLVLDPFCGCATTCVAAEKLGRRWSGIDVSVKAYELVKERLRKEVADPEDMLKYDKRIQFSTDPPPRTDDGAGAKDQKYVYVISHPNYAGEYKVGIARDVKSRLNSYQTSDPDRAFKLEHKRLTEHYRALEQHIHEKFDNKREWVRADLRAIIDAIDAYDHEDNGRLNLD